MTPENEVKFLHVMSFSGPLSGPNPNINDLEHFKDLCSRTDRKTLEAWHISISSMQEWSGKSLDKQRQHLSDLLSSGHNYTPKL